MFAAVVLLALVSPVSTARLTGMVNYRGRVVPAHATSTERGHHWEVVSETVQHDIMHHFGVRVASGVTSEIFYVAGMPAAALCWTTTNTKGHPAVTSVHDAEKKRLEAQLSEATKRTEEAESIRAKLAAQLSEATKRAEEAESIRANLAAQLSEVTTRVVATNAKKAETAVQTATRRFESGARLSYCGRAQVFGDYTLKPFTQGVVVGPSSDGNPEYLAMKFPRKTDAVNIQVRYLNSPPRMNERNARSYTTR